MAEVAKIFNSFQDYLNYEQELREEIRVIVRKLEKCSRDILMVLQNIHNENPMEEDIIVSQYCAKAREHFETVRQYYSELEKLVPNDQYYRFHDQWRYVTQRLCFLVSLIIYLEVKTLVTKETVAEFLGIKSNREEGFHLDIEEFLMGLLELSAELTRFAVNSVTCGDYNRPIEIARFVNELNAGFRLLNLKNDNLRKRFDALKYDVKKIEEVVYDLSIRGLKPTSQQISPAQ
ncbi:GSCOCG00007126001-RA-CDS [Cotesia congregata]|uniref:Translin n=1 Tax=Cotesia congregata TaxID=51543 RepID=A0A8J2MTN5_COTCN|nr:GSCOCG00004275001-RA-CDS [Cotesia congregata]CAD6218369.1 GSCOCG00011444001-RA-CDS [Cotesia congregata]CAD6233312.1 GSCOCG00007126001-RA-CDS [Cotesia congregata]CAG5089730.1 Similar to TSN: Translin (Gallus gallus) [Cotesia congregata]CAG5092907.1 Similar to TSN: Translin (Gallus gallus) [Cotesia congregata]